jgi:integrase
MPLTLVPPKPGRTPNYHIRGTYLGVTINRSTRTPDRRLAVKLKKQIEKEIETGALTPSGGLTFLEAAVAYMKAGGDRTFLGPIIEYDGAYSIRDKAIEIVVQQDLDHIADALYPDNTAASRNRAVYTPIIAVLHRAGIERRFKRPKGWQGKKSKSCLEPDQAFALLNKAEALDLEFGLLCYTCLYTGRRIGELLNDNTRLRNLNLKQGKLYLGKTKNGEPVMVHLPPIVVEKFKAMPPRPARPNKSGIKKGKLRKGEAGMSQRDAGVPFLERDPDARLFRFHKGGYLRNMLADAMESAGLSFPPRERGFHLFCHTYATWMLSGGMDNYALARTGRWKDPRSVEGYLHTQVSAEAKRADLLPTPDSCKTRAGAI